MKNTNTIISHIKSFPQFRMLKKHYCYQKFISSLSPRFQKAIAFAYIRNNTLFIALSHPGFKMELNYKKKEFIDILNMIKTIEEKCQFIRASKVVLFNSKYGSFRNKRQKSRITTVPYYKEQSSGEFSIESHDKEIVDAFETIKKSIKSM